MPVVINNSFIPHDRAKFAFYEVWRRIGQVVEFEGYREDYEPETGKATRVLGVKPEIRRDFLRWALGDATVTVPVPATFTLRRIIPAQHPCYPWLYCVSANMVQGRGALGKSFDSPLQDFDGSIAVDPTTGEELNNDMYFPYDMQGFGLNPIFNNTGYLTYQLTYEDLPFEVRTDAEIDDDFGGSEIERYVSREFTWSMTALPLPKGQIFFVEGPFGPPAPKAIPEAGGILHFPRQVIVLTWHQVPSIPANLELFIGKVNVGPFDLGMGYPTYAPETLLCLPPQITRKRNETGRVLFTIKYQLMHQPDGWQQFPSPDGNLYEARWFPAGVAVGAGSPIYRTANFDLLFLVSEEARFH